MMLSSIYRLIVVAALRTRGMRLAGEGEPGWYVPVIVDGEVVKAWATDAPEVRA